MQKILVIIMAALVAAAMLTSCSSASASGHLSDHTRLCKLRALNESGETHVHRLIAQRMDSLFQVGDTVLLETQPYVIVGQRK